MGDAPGCDDVLIALSRMLRTLIEAELGVLERGNESSTAPAARIAFVVQDPRTAWLSPLARLLVSIDVLCPDRSADTEDTARAMERETRRLLRGQQPAYVEFHERMRAWCATDPAVASARDALVRLVDPGLMAESSSGELHERHIRAMKHEHGAGD